MIKMRLANPAVADRGARLAGADFTGRLVPRDVGAVDYEFPSAQASQAHHPCADIAVPSDTSPDGTAFSHFTESLSVGAREKDEAAPVVATPAAGAAVHTGNAILLPDHMMVLARAIAAYERCCNERAVEIALIEYAKLIGAGALARAVADLSDELAAVPDFRRTADNRFRGGP